MHYTGPKKYISHQPSNHHRAASSQQPAASNHHRATSNQQPAFNIQHPIIFFCNFMFNFTT